MELQPFAICTLFQFFTNVSYSTLFFSLITLLMIVFLITTFSSLSLSPWFPKINIFCSCETCHAYLTSSWSKDFVNLCDWYSHLLRNSPSKTIHIHVLKNTITANPDNVEYMLKTRFNNYPKGKNFSTILGDFLGQGSEKKLREALRMINILAKEVIRQRRKMGFSNNKDLLSRFMSTINDDTFLRDIVISFLLAGRDTVTSALTSFFWLLSKHPEVGTEILLEAEEVIGADKELEATVAFQQLQKLQYLQAVVYESMRLYPPIQFDSKFCLEDDVLPDGTSVKSGTRVTYHPYAMGRLEEIWGPDCLEFKPQRWLKNGVFCPQSPFKYPVFQGGMRVCLGKEMALLEVKSVAISLLRRFHIEMVSPQHHITNTPRFSPGLTSTFSCGLPVK
ncbi:Cytochrome P450, partial [Sesbania bispinosa]